MEWQGVVGTLSGTVLGAVLSFCITSYNHREQRRKQLRIARMQVVSSLRRWMREMAWRIDQTKLSRDSDGHGGTSYAEIPDFQFETSLERVSVLEDVAEKLFDLIHAKDTANIDVKWCIEIMRG